MIRYYISFRFKNQGFYDFLVVYYINKSHRAFNQKLNIFFIIYRVFFSVDSIHIKHTEFFRLFKCRNTNAQRHIHLTPEDARKFGVTDKQTVKLQTYTSRPAVFEDVAVRVSPEFASFVHLDYDEANACGFQKGDLGRILP